MLHDEVIDFVGTVIGRNFLASNITRTKSSSNSSRITFGSFKLLRKLTTPKMRIVWDQNKDANDQNNVEGGERLRYNDPLLEQHWLKGKMCWMSYRR